MIRRANELNTVKKNLRGGKGEVLMQHLAFNGDELYGHGKMLAHLTVLPGDSIGEHYHEGDGEFIFVLKGTADYNDNGTWTTISTGDFTICNSGEMHSVVNNGTEPVELLALVLHS